MISRLLALLAATLLIATPTHASAKPESLRLYTLDCGHIEFFTIYSKSEDVWLAPAWLEGREVVAVYEDRAASTPSHFMWLEWRDGRISFIRDYRYVGYVIADAELALASNAPSPSDRTVHP